MKTKTISLLNKFATLALAFASTTSAIADDSLDALKKDAVKSYVAIAGYTTADAQAKALVLKEAITKLAAAPSAALHQKAKDAWNTARMPALQAELFTIGSEEPAVTKMSPFSQIESMLWGEDESVDGPGARTFEYFTATKTAELVKLLEASASLVVTETAEAAAAWKAGGDKDTAGAKFAALPTGEALKQIFGNISTLSERLGKERIGKAYESREEERGCANYSDLTHLEFIYSCSGLANVVAGAYVGSDKEAKVQGSGPLQLAAKVDAKQGEKLKLAINRVMLAVTSFRPPFDRALMAPDDSPAREAIKEMMDALEEFSTEINATAKALGLVGEAAKAE